VLGVGSRERHTELGPDGVRRGKEGESEYTVDETAIRYGAGIEPGTAQNEAYSRFPPRRFVRYGAWLDAVDAAVMDLADRVVDDATSIADA
jgi:hypothetical protein